MSNKASAKRPVKKRQPHVIDVELQPNDDLVTKVAQTFLQPTTQAASIVRAYTPGADEGGLDLTALIAELTKQAQASSGGDLSRAEAMLIAQAHALDAIFAKLALLAAPGAGESLDAFEAYLRLALKAQSQCRATLETLGTLKNPSPALFVRQQNIGVNQQVNNRALDAPAEHPNPAQTREPLELQHGQRLDAAKTGATSKADSALVPVGKLNGAQKQNKARHRLAATPTKVACG